MALCNGALASIFYKIVSAVVRANLHLLFTTSHSIGHSQAFGVYIIVFLFQENWFIFCMVCFIVFYTVI